MANDLLPLIANDCDTVISLQELLVSIKGLAPENGGIGEMKKAEALQAKLAIFGFPAPRLMNAPDARVPDGARPNFAYTIPGKDTSRTLWILAHLDVVPAGDLSQWNTDPFTLTVDGDRLIGRGVEDNHQAVVSSALVGKALLASKTTPPINLGILYLADEEVGNAYGLNYVLAHHADLFKKNDLFLVPDCGDPQGLQIEVAEKSILWLKVTLEGKQCHASMPDEGINTLRAAADFIMNLDRLAKRFDVKDPLFSPSRSTFEPTKKEANVDGINIIPGRDTFYIDCRILPTYTVDEVLAAIKEIGEEVSARHKVTIAYEEKQRVDAAPPTSPDSEIVRRVVYALKEAGKGNPRIEGIGGGTFAALLRRQGHQAVAWATILEMAHQPNETSLVSATLNDAQIIARILFAKID